MLIEIEDEGVAATRRDKGCAERRRPGGVAIYGPRLARFLQPDPIGYGDGMNPYGYVGGDPVNATDPSGMCTVMPMNLWDVFVFVEGKWEKRRTEVGETHGYRLMDCHPNSWPMPGGGGGGGGVGGGSTSENSAAPTLQCRTQRSGGSPRFRASIAPRGNGIERTWNVRGAQNGIVLQEIVRTETFANNQSQTMTFYEAWVLSRGEWIYGNTDSFDPGSGLTSLTVTGIASFYPNASLPSSMVPGSVKGAGNLPASRERPEIRGNPTPPVNITFSCS